VQAVVARAKSSVGSFYARFGGKDDLLEYLGERVWDEALGRWNEAVESRAWSEMSLAQITEGAVGLLIDVRSSRVGHLRDLDHMSGGGDAYERFRRHLIGNLESLLLERQSEMEHTRPDLAVRLGLSAVLGMIDVHLSADGSSGTPSAHHVPRDVLAQECTDLLLSYLAGSGLDRDTEPVEFFDVWG
jgi:AcrR family transcriptional regulator